MHTARDKKHRKLLPPPLGWTSLVNHFLVVKPEDSHMPIFRALYGRWFSDVVPRPASLASPRNLTEAQTCKPRPRPTVSEALGVRSSCLCFDKPTQALYRMFRGSKSPDHCILNFSETFLKEFLDIYLNK